MPLRTTPATGADTGADTGSDSRTGWVPRLRARLATAVAGEVAAAPDVLLEGSLAQQDALAVLDAVGRMAEALLSCGASAADVTALTLRAAHGAGLEHTQVDITFTAVIVSTAGQGGTPLTAVRVVSLRATDYSRLSALY